MQRSVSAVHIRLMTPSYTQPQLSLPGIRDPRRDYPFENLSVQCGTTPSNFNTSIQRPLARQRVISSWNASGLLEPGAAEDPARRGALRGISGCLGGPVR